MGKFLMATDEQLQAFGWAPGGYTIRCSDCPSTNTLSLESMGAKRSWRCREHAEERFNERERILAADLIPFNLNHSVQVKLNDRGIAILRKRHDELAKRAPSLSPFEVKVDEFGYTKFQLWHLMQVFGEHISMGMTSPFETEILIPKDPK
jgi:hypothetical protein